MENENYEEMQQEELQALQAIYMDDYSDFTKRGAPPEIMLQLTPLQSIVGKDVHAKLDLRIKYTTKYPRDPPVLNIENAKGLSKEHILTLQKELNEMSLNLCGEVMILQLAHHCQSFLHKFNTPNLSFFEQMVANHQKQEEILLKEKQKKLEAQVAQDKERELDVIRQVKEELQRREEVLKLEKRKRQISQSSPANSFSLGDCNLKQDYSCPRTKEKKFTVAVFRNKNEEKKVFCSLCVGHYFEGACLLSGIEEHTGKSVSVCEWRAKLQNARKKTVHFANDVEAGSVSKQVQRIEQEFNFLKSKLSHPGLLSYHNLDVDQNTGGFTAKLLIDGINGPSLSTYLQDGGLPVVQIQHIAKQLVDTLLYLHGKSVVHRDLNLLNTFVSSSNMIVVAGYAAVRRISDLWKQLMEDQQDEMPSSSFTEYRKKVKSGKKGDIFHLGILLLSLHCGSTDHGFPVNIPDNVQPSFASFLQACTFPDENQRSSIHQLAKHSFLHEKILENPSYDGKDRAKPLVENSISNKRLDQDSAVLPFLSSVPVLDKSRLLQEFEVIQYLGEGGFGSVVQVRNKLDSNFYAIKKIPLNSKNSQFYKKITREVKLLSRLNHENVVRYYNSWIESEDACTSDTSSDTLSSIASCKANTKINEIHHQANRKDQEDSLLKLNNFEVPSIYSNGVNDSWCQDVSSRNSSDESSSSSSSENDSVSSLMNCRSSSSKRIRSKKGESSEGIVFQMDDSMMQFGDAYDSEDSTDETTDTQSTKPTTATSESSSESSIPVQFLYIQMEYCEKSTLRNVIDQEELCKVPDRVWRLFREIVEGLAHVHAQGIIHRDLKPFNIFMDSCDRIKIGDFGLATVHTSVSIDTPNKNSVKEMKQSTTDDRMTGKVGTAMYVAPELGNAKSRIKFSQKVDMYSLGVILFEMFYRPLETGMERVMVLSDIRAESVTFPEDFSLKKFAKEQTVITWLLTHDPEARPTAQELLESGYVPPKLEDRQLDELIKHTLSQNNSTRYQKLMASIFTQDVSPVSDQTYDSDCHGKNEDQILDAARVLQYVRKILSNIFIKHGAVYLDTPLLMPKGKVLDSYENVATLIGQSGLQLCLPYDSRIRFARFLSRNSISNLRRYYIGKVYRDQKLIGAHPIGLYECTFDLVTDSHSSLLPEAEIISAVSEIIKEFPNLHKRNFYIRLNHAFILKAIFSHHSFPNELQEDVCKILESTKNSSEREVLLKQCLIQASYPEHVVNKIIIYLSIEGTLQKAKEVLQILRKTKASISNLVKQAFQDIERVSKCLEYLAVDMQIIICTYLQPNASFYGSLVFQCVAQNTRKRKHGGVDIFAIGGRYDKLIESMSQYAETSTLPSAVGVSIAVEKILISVVEKGESADETLSSLSECDAIVCTLSNNPKLDTLLNVLCELRASGISATLYSYDLHQDYSIEEIQDHCKDNGINNLVVLKDSDAEFVRVRIRDKEWFTESRISRAELCDYLHQRLVIKYENNKSQDTEITVKPSLTNQAGVILPKFTLVALEKLEQKYKSKIKSIFMNKFKDELHQYFGDRELQVVVTKLDKRELKVVAAYLDLKSSTQDFSATVRELMNVFEIQGAHVKRVCTEVKSIYDKENSSIIVLYSYVAEMYKVLL